MANFEAFTFFLGLAHSTECWHFNYVDVVRGSVPPSFALVSSASCSYEGVAWPSPTFAAMSCAATAVVEFSCSTAFCNTSCTARTSAAISYYLFSSNCAMHSLASSFFFSFANLSSSVMSWACHYGGHASKTLKMVSSMATNGSFVHYFVESFHVMMYILCMSALNSTKFYRLLYTMGDKHGFRLIHIWMFISMRTHKILLSHILFASFMAQSKAYFVASSNSLSMMGNWLSSEQFPCYDHYGQQQPCIVEGFTLLLRFATIL